MRLAGRGELKLVSALRQRFGATGAKGVITGIGDDAAVLQSPRHMLVSTDMMTEGVHFDLTLATPAQIGFKLVSVNVSDICAMGGRAQAILIALAAPGSTSTRIIDGLFEGVRLGLERYGIALVGGDVSSSVSGICLSATVLGHAAHPVLRSGAKAGDVIYVSGPLGDAACGFELLKRHGRAVDLDRATRVCGLDIAGPLLGRHLMPEARISPKGKINSMMDISDGLSLDLMRLCEASGVGACVDKARLPLSEALRAAAPNMGLDPYALALNGGEDYELLYTMASESKPPKGAIAIGGITDGCGVLIKSGRTLKPLAPKGYRHFR